MIIRRLHNSNRFNKIVRFVAVLGVQATLSGQTGTASVTGLIRDPTDSAIAGATVRIVNTESGVTTAAVSNEEGFFRVNSVLPGTYRIEASAPGFQTVVQTAVLSTGQTLGVDLILPVGEYRQTVDVEANAGLAETQSSSLAQVVNHNYIENLPLSNHSANSLINLSPGVVMIDPGQGAENYPIFSLAGGRARNQMFTLDGGSIGNAVGLTRPSQIASLPLDALEEFRVMSNNYAAEYGHSTGGFIALSTRSGTNQFHGSVFEYFRNSALDARNFFAKSKPPLHLNQFGGSLGGPVEKDKKHFFMSWEQTRQASSVAVLSTVPTLAQRGGDFSAIAAQIYDPFSLANGVKQPFQGNRIPLNRIDAVARAASAYWPIPNRQADPNGANNYLGNTAFHLTRNIVVGKLDDAVDLNNRLSARYYINDAGSTEAGSYGIPIADPLAIATDIRIQSVLGTYVHTFSPTLLNNLQLSLMQRKFIQTRGGAGENYAQKIGLAGVSPAAFPTLNVTGYALLGSQAVANSSIARIQTPIRDLQIQDSISKFAGRHALKSGLEYRRGYNNESNDLSSSGNLIFNRLITDQPGASNTGDAFASFLLGAANSAAISKTDTIPSRASYWAAYVQDDIRMTANLTLNLGLRWETETPRYVDGDKQNAFDPVALNPVSGTPGVVTFSGRNGVPRTAFDGNYRNFGPRAGFAYSAPFMKGLVIRAGAGLFYGPNVSNSITTAASLGFSDNVSYVTSQAETAYALLLSNGFPPYRRPSIDTPGFGAVKLGDRPTTAVTYFDRHRPSPVSYQYNFDLQKLLSENLLVEVGYLGNVSHHLTANDLTINQLRPEQFGPGDTQLLRPFPQFSNVSMLNPAIGNSTYHAVFVKTERRFASGFSFLAHYTFSKFIDDVASGDEFGDPGSYMDQYNRRLDKGLSGGDVPHHFLFAGLYEVPRLKHHRLANALAGGWRVGIDANFQSGAVFTVFDSANTTNGFPAGAVRPDIVANPRLGVRTLQRYFNTTAFVHPPNYRFGNSPRSVLRGPGSENVDFNVARSIPLSERLRTEFRGEFFNVFNFANFNPPGHTLGNVDFGVINSAKAARTAQMVLRVIF
jgi:hypothetical protein